MSFARLKKSVSIILGLLREFPLIRSPLDGLSHGLVVRSNLFECLVNGLKIAEFFVLFLLGIEFVLDCQCLLKVYRLVDLCLRLFGYFDYFILFFLQIILFDILV